MFILYSFCTASLSEQIGSHLEVLENFLRDKIEAK